LIELNYFTFCLLEVLWFSSFSCFTQWQFKLRNAFWSI
jgi:hypothetical protein